MTMHCLLTVTTRAPRPGEEDGIAYFFRSREEFEQLIREDALRSNMPSMWRIITVLPVLM